MCIRDRFHSLYKWGGSHRGRIPPGGDSGREALVYVLELIIRFSRELVKLVQQIVDIVGVGIEMSRRRIRMLGHFDEKVSNQFAQPVWVLDIGFS